MPVFRVIAMAIAKTFSKLFGLATFTFFGRLPTRDDDKVAIVGMLSLFWLAAVVSIVFPNLAEMMIPFLPDDDLVVRLSSVALVVLLPILVGLITATVRNRRDRGVDRAKQALFGYVYAAVISLLVVALVVTVPLVKASYIFRRFDLKHIAIMIKKGTYEDVLQQVQSALRRHGIETEVISPHWVIWRIFSWLVWVEGHIFRRDIAQQMKIIRGELEDAGWFEITLHATDISVVGQKVETTCVMAILMEELDEQYVYFSWDDESQALEDRIADCQRRLEAGEQVPYEEIASMPDELRRLALSEEEWNAIRRQIYRLERDYYKLEAGVQVDELLT